MLVPTFRIERHGSFYVATIREALPSIVEHALLANGYDRADSDAAGLIYTALRSVAGQVVEIAAARGRSHASLFAAEPERARNWPHERDAAALHAVEDLMRVIAEGYDAPAELTPPSDEEMRDRAAAHRREQRLIEQEKRELQEEEDDAA